MICIFTVWTQKIYIETNNDQILRYHDYDVYVHGDFNVNIEVQIMIVDVTGIC